MMTRLLAAGMVTVGASVVLSLIAKATIVTAVAIAAESMARRRRAAVRHLITAAAFVVLALLPAATLLVPVIDVPVGLPPTPATGDTAHPMPIDVRMQAALSTAEQAADAGAGRRGIWRAVSWIQWMPIVWMAGVICSVIPVALGLWQVGRVRRHGVPWHERQTMMNALAHNAGFDRPIAVMVHEGIAGPVTCGLVRPVIVFPLDARSWRDADVRRAVVHELEHVRRRDWLTLCLARTICALYWFDPLVWIANRQLCLNAERACDDAVLRESRALSYADQLVTLAERSQVHPRRPLLAMANRGDLATRVHAVLNTHQQRGPAGVRVRVAATIAAAVAVSLLAPLRPVASAVQQTPAETRLPTTAEPARPRFDVASVKPSPDDRIMNVRPLPGRLTAHGTLQVLMQAAYGVQSFQIVGGPNWLTTARYEVEAKADAGASRDQLFLMLQSLLEDRFRLKTHREVRELPMFTLAAANRRVQLPAPRESSCVRSDADAAVEWAGGRMAAPGELQPAKGRCGSALVVLGPAGAQMRGGSVAMPELIRLLSMLLGRSVADKTGFTSLFDVHLDFVPDDTTPTMPPPPPDSAISGVSLGQALQQQLGLRLEPAKGPVEVMVIDRADRPSPN